MSRSGLENTVTLAQSSSLFNFSPPTNSATSLKITTLNLLLLAPPSASCTLAGRNSSGILSAWNHSSFPSLHLSTFSSTQVLTSPCIAFVQLIRFANTASYLIKSSFRCQESLTCVNLLRTCLSSKKNFSLLAHKNNVHSTANKNNKPEQSKEGFFSICLIKSALVLNTK